MESVWDIYYAVLKDGSLKLDQYTERLLGAATKKTDKTLFLVLRFLIATTPFVVVVVVVVFFMVWSVLLCSRTPFASISLATYLDQLRLFGLLSLTV